MVFEYDDPNDIESKKNNRHRPKDDFCFVFLFHDYTTFPRLL